MKNTIRTGLYRLYDPSMDWGVAHLYEHLLIQSFNEYVESHGFSLYLYGWVSGETFENVIFIEYGFYNPAIEKLFMKFMRQPSRVNLDMLENEIQRVQAEDEVLLDVADLDELKSLLQEMDKTDFVNTEFQDSIEYIENTKSTQSIIKEKQSRRSFKQVTVAVGLPSASIEERVIFLRLTPIIFDAIDAKLFAKGMYENEVSWPVYNTPHDAMLAHAIYTTKKGTITNQDIKKIVKRALADIQVEGRDRELERYISGFAVTPNWHTFPIDYFRHTGLLVSRSGLAKLFTASNVQRIVNMLKVDVVATASHHLDALK